MGTEYAQTYGSVLGRVVPLDLHPLSEAGILESCKKTFCSSGRSMIEALGFKEVRRNFLKHPHGQSKKDQKRRSMLTFSDCQIMLIQERAAIRNSNETA